MADFEIENGVLKKYKGNAENVIIPKGVISIGDFAFSSLECADKVKSITIPNGVTAIGNGAFSHCGKLASITIPRSVSSIGMYAFRGCGSLANITIPDKVAYIDFCAFEKCSAIKSIIIPSSVLSLKCSVFNECAKLQTIYCEASAKPLGWDDDWQGDCPAEILWGGKKEADPDTMLIPDFVIDNDVLIKYKGEGEKVVIPDGVASIGRNAFAYCETLKSVIIPKGVISIEKYAFCNCRKLESIHLSSTVKYIGERAFQNCYKLGSIDFPESIVSIGDFAFGKCGRLISIIILKGVSSIGKSAFWECGFLKTVSCEAMEKPAGWDESWLDCYAEVVWNNKKTANAQRKVIAAAERRIEDEAEAARMAEAAEMRRSGSKTKRSVQKEAEIEQAPEKNGIFSVFKKRK